MRIIEIINEDNTQTQPENEQESGNLPNKQRDDILSLETGGYTVNPRVKQLQSYLQKFGYDLGHAGVDGKYGPYTAKAVSEFKKDYGLSGSGKQSGSDVFSMIHKINNGKVKKINKTSNSANKINSKNGLNSLPNIPEVHQAKKVAEQYLGSPISDDEFSMLFRASIAEASPDPKERAGVMAVMLNRVKSPRYPNSIKGVLTQKNQFQAVTGTKNNGHKASPHFSRTPSESHARSLANAIIQGLPSANSSWLNFTSAIKGAYGAGTNIGFMNKVANSRGSKRIGDTWFGTV